MTGTGLTGTGFLRLIVVRARSLAIPDIEDVVSAQLVVSAAPRVSTSIGDGSVGPVLLGSGAIDFEATDACAPSISGQLSTGRRYNSVEALAGQGGPLGIGWSDSNTYTLKATGDGGVAMDSPDGAQVEFDMPAGGEAVASSTDGFEKLQRAADGSFEVITKDAMKLAFDSLLPASDDGSSSHLAGNITGIEDRYGNEVRIQRDALGRIESIVDENGNGFVYEYEAVPAQTTYNISYAESVDTPCFERGQFYRLRQCSGGPEFAWRLKRIRSQSGTTDFGYSPAGNLEDVTNTGNECGSGGVQVTHYDYMTEGAPGHPEIDTTHLLKSVTNPNGHKTFFSYDFNQSGTPAVAVRQGEGDEQVSVEYAYSRNGEGDVTAATVEDGNGNPRTYALEAGRIARVDGPQATAWTYQYNEQNQMTSQVDPAGIATTIGYDANGNQTSFRQQSGSESVVRSAVFDTRFNTPIRSTDANGAVSEFTLDPATGMVATVKGPTGAITRITYYPNGKVHTVTPPRGLSTTYEYDEFGNVTKVTRQTSAEE